MESWLLQQVPVLPAMRVLALCAAFPVMAGPGAPRLVRLYVGLSLCLVLVPLPWESAQPALGAMATLLAAPVEILIGLAIGMAYSLVFHMLAIAGDFAGQEMGLNAASQIDPVSGRPMPLLARLFETLGLVLFVEGGGMALLLHTVRASFDAVPCGALLPPDRLAGTLLESSFDCITLGVTAALPAGLVLLLLTTFTTIAARTLPRLHVFDFAFATRMLAAIFLVALLLPRLGPALLTFAAEMTTRLRFALGAS